MKLTVASALGLAVVALAACQSSTPTPLTAADEAKIRGVDSTFARDVNAGNASALAALYTDDGVLLPPNMARARGRSAITQAYTGLIAAGTPHLTLAPNTIAGRQDMAYVVGTYHISWTPKAGAAAPPPADSGKYVVVLMRQTEGNWKLVANTWSSDAPLPGMAAPAATAPAAMPRH